MENINVHKTYFLDASAIVKILISEPGSEAVRSIADSPQRLHTSWILIAEALGVLKRKWLTKTLTDHQYGASVHYLFALLRDDRLHPVDVGIEAGAAQLQSREYDIIRIRQRYPELDVADALQVAVIQEGFPKFLAGESRPRLLTADRGLGKVAEKEGIPVTLV